MLSQYQLRLEDESSNATLYLRTSAVYQYQAKGTSAQPDVRRFRLTVLPAAPASPLTVSMQVTPVRSGGGLCVQVTPSAPANLTIEVRTVTGLLLRTLSKTASTANQPISIGWDGHALGNKLMPSGVYLIHLTAQTPDGFTLHQVQTTMMRR